MKLHRRIDKLGLNIPLYLHHLRRWALLAVLPGLVAAGLTYGYTTHQRKTYQASTVLFVQQAQSTTPGAVGSTDVQSSQQLAMTYAAMIVDPTIARQAERSLAKKYPGYLINYSASQNVQKSAQQNTQLFVVTVTDAVPTRAMDAANAVAQIFIQRIRTLERQRFAADELRIEQQVAQARNDMNRVVAQLATYPGSASGRSALKTVLSTYQLSYSTLLTSLNNFRATQDATLDTVNLYSPAISADITGPYPLREALIAGIVVLVLAAVLLYLYNYVNDLPRGPEDVEEAAGAPVLGTVQKFESRGRGGSLVVQSHPSEPVAEAYRLVRTNIQFTDVEAPPHSLLVTSALPAEGKSTTASNIALTFAETGHPVTIVDADLRRPSLHRIFQAEKGRFEGLTSLLMTRGELNGHNSGMDDWPNLSVIASGPLPPNPATILSTDRMRGLIQHFEANSSMVLIDSPPILAVADAAILSTMVDGVILVVDPHQTKRRDIRAARETIEGVGGKIVGVVMNRLRPRGAMYYYYYGSYSYKGGYKNRYGQKPKEGREVAAGID